MASVCNAAIYDPATSVTTFTSPLPAELTIAENPPDSAPVVPDISARFIASPASNSFPVIAHSAPYPAALPTTPPAAPAATIVAAATPAVPALAITAVIAATVSIAVIDPLTKPAANESPEANAPSPPNNPPTTMDATPASNAPAKANSPLLSTIATGLFKQYAHILPPRTP